MPCAGRAPGAAAIIVAVAGVATALALNIGYTTYALASQQRQAATVQRKLCTTMAELAALKPPPGNPATNPSRAYDQHLHATLTEIGADFGCR
jgi:hypothetical protein